MLEAGYRDENVNGLSAEPRLVCNSVLQLICAHCGSHLPFLLSPFFFSFKKINLSSNICLFKENIGNQEHNIWREIPEEARYWEWG